MGAKFPPHCPECVWVYDPNELTSFYRCGRSLYESYNGGDSLVGPFPTLAEPGESCDCSLCSEVCAHAAAKGIIDKCAADAFLDGGGEE